MQGTPSPAQAPSGRHFLPVRRRAGRESASHQSVPVRGASSARCGSGPAGTFAHIVSKTGVAAPCTWSGSSEARCKALPRLRRSFQAGASCPPGGGPVVKVPRTSIVPVRGASSARCGSGPAGTFALIVSKTGVAAPCTWAGGGEDRCKALPRLRRSFQAGVSSPPGGGPAGKVPRTRESWCEALFRRAAAQGQQGLSPISCQKQVWQRLAPGQAAVKPGARHFLACAGSFRQAFLARSEAGRP